MNVNIIGLYRQNIWLSLIVKMFTIESIKVKVTSCNDFKGFILMLYKRILRMYISSCYMYKCRMLTKSLFGDPTVPPPIDIAKLIFILPDLINHGKEENKYSIFTYLRQTYRMVEYMGYKTGTARHR